jgi:hypothetical protein
MLRDGERRSGNREIHKTNSDIILLLSSLSRPSRLSGDLSLISSNQSNILTSLPTPHHPLSSTTYLLFISPYLDPSSPRQTETGISDQHSDPRRTEWVHQNQNRTRQRPSPTAQSSIFTSKYLNQLSTPCTAFKESVSGA